ncbi:cobaltochelatase subunit CobN [Candidatus Contubernalis alkaliaceticus]|uniref:cobaltochelatase subunit CobN n=1 Tax=Candidatus Contubernalis alkaliaceticus TaxID=338645 RepID=UPI001F4BFFDA|nr:cobaltochelatase subunit CobN [Candidatus Contubernalis alkalaceticus]
MHIIAAVGLDFEQEELMKAAELVKNISIKFFSAALINNTDQRKEIIDFVREKAQAVIITDHAWHTASDNFCQDIKESAGDIPVIPIGSELIQNHIYNADLQVISEKNRYFIYGGPQNMKNALHYIGVKLWGIDVQGVVEPEGVALEGIFHPDSELVYDSLESFTRWYENRPCCGKGPWVGLIIHRSSWISNNLEVEKALINELENNGLKVIPVFTYGYWDSELKTKDFDGMVRAYFSFQGRPVIEGLINLQVFVLRTVGAGGDVFQQAVDKMQQLDIPLFRPLISFFSSRERWEESPQGLTMEIPWCFTVPEMQGMIEPMILGCREENGKSLPILDRINKFASRVKNWIYLRETPNHEKKLVIILHNAPCSGVEATVGMAAGLDAFESTVGVMRELQKNGWSVENLPGDGSQLHKMIMEKKAYSDFRWTSVEDIIASGGCLYSMPMEGSDGYLGFYEELEEQCRKKMEEFWGPPPGEGMVYDGRLIITGIKFGNVTVLVEPKRGCYGAKCTGEVCKILQDPSCPPPHQYLAAFKYIEDIYKAHAVLHVGAHGSVEFLPGKSNALSKSCFPDIVLGNLPNLYIYNAGVGTEGILAKRRTSAVIIDHLPPVCSFQKKEVMELVDLANEYREVLCMKSQQVPVMEQRIRELIALIPGAQEIMQGEGPFLESLEKLKNSLVQSVCRPRTEKTHVFGRELAFEDACSYIREVVQSDLKVMELLRKYWEQDYQLQLFLMKFIEKTLNCRKLGSLTAKSLCSQDLNSDLAHAFDNLGKEVQEIFNKLQLIPQEITNLCQSLEGRYVPPGPCGMPDDNGKNIIPTGRNFYLMDIEKVPTRAAWEVGSSLAEQLIQRYIEDEGQYPEKIAMNMISLDISRTKGEQLSQALYLMGMKPVWDPRGRVVNLEVIPLEQLNRPRIDVTIRVSGILRDCYPQALGFIDSAVCKAAALPEPEELNFVRKHTLQIAQVLKKSGEAWELTRQSTIRIFGDRPGTYGAGVDLALKASAWKNERDLAKTFVYFSSYAYGNALAGQPAALEFVENVKAAQLAYDTTTSKRCDILSSGFGASVQGGFNLVKKVMHGKELKQYHGSRENPEEIKVSSLEEKMQENLEEKLFNPLWKESVKEKGYLGASELMQRMQNVFEWQCVTEIFPDTVLDRLVEEYVNDDEMREWFLEHNPFSAEEIARRFLELFQREKWQADSVVLQKLKSNYLKLEGDLEERLGENQGEIQAGTIEVINDAEVEEWKEKLEGVEKLFKTNDLNSIGKGD